MIYPEDEGVEQRHGIHIAYKEDCVNLILTIVPSSDLFVFLVSAVIETLVPLPTILYFSNEYSFW